MHSNATVLLDVDPVCCVGTRARYYALYELSVGYIVINYLDILHQLMSKFINPLYNVTFMIISKKVQNSLVKSHFKKLIQCTLGRLLAIVMSAISPEVF